MGDFFDGWKRQVGCSTLMLAMAFMAAWVRSFNTQDQVEFPFLRPFPTVFVSTNGMIAMQNHVHPGLRTDWYSIDISKEKGARYARAWKQQWNWRLFGVTTGSNDQQNYTFVNISYWTIITPLTLLSAVLLLSKPGKSAQRKFNEPKPVEGT